MKECKINDYLSVREEGDTWNIYVANRIVNECEYKLYNISPEEIYNSKDYSSAQEYYTKNVDSNLKKVNFDQACTILKEWYKYQYNTTLLTRDGAFPLLKMLYIAGEPVALQVFESELLISFIKGDQDTINYLINDDYEDYLAPYELQQLPKKSKNLIQKAFIIKRFTIRYRHAKSNIMKRRHFSNFDRIYDNLSKKLDGRFATLMNLPPPKEEHFSDLSHLNLDDKQTKKIEKLTIKELVSIIHGIFLDLEKKLRDKDRISKDVIISRHLTLKLIDNKTIVYVYNDPVIQCKFYDAAEGLDSFPKQASKKLDPETAFETHCNNLKRWVENSYDSKSLPRKITFPLLRELAEEGDNKANKRLREEVIRRYLEGNLTKMEYRILEEYLPFLDEEDIDRILHETNNIVVKSEIASYFAKTKNIIKALEIYYECKYSRTTHIESLRPFTHAWSWMVFYYLENKDNINTVRAQKHLIELVPNNARYWHDLGDLYLSNIKDYNKALNAFLKALDLDSHNSLTLSYLALTHSELGNDSLAIQYINQSYRIAPDLYIINKKALFFLQLQNN